MLTWSAENALKLNVQIKPVEPTLEAGAQIQQMLTAECIDDYAGNFQLRNAKCNVLLILLCLFVNDRHTDPRHIVPIQWHSAKT